MTNKILPTDIGTPLSVRMWPNIDAMPGATAISMNRRVNDSRFARRYFVGNGIDVGGGNDSLALYREFFPLVRNIVIYDKEQGDAQLLANVDDESFDFLYSSHCLEHLHSPQEGLANWIRVIKPGGHLVISVPDEDLYEQQHWPSIFNTDHKHTFTVGKKGSWSPVSINVIDLIKPLLHVAKPLSINTIDHAHRFGISGDFDQTRTPLAECAIEIILIKHKK